MFSFHKPKVYRSSAGCCICKAKSSSSRFTDSKKYENDFVECFQLTVSRKGEICNACVLLVKRFKRLPPGSDRHWGHVVDARIGPGLKSITKFKQKKKKSSAISISTASSLFMSQKIRKLFKKNIGVNKQHTIKDGSSDEGSLPEYDGDIDKFYYDERSDLSNFTYNKLVSRSLRKSKYPKKNLIAQPCVSPIDNDVWVEKQSCCGLVYESSIHNAVIIDLESYNPCSQHTIMKQLTEPVDAGNSLNKVLLLKQITSAPIIISSNNLNYTVLSSKSISDESIERCNIPLKKFNIFPSVQQKPVISNLKNIYDNADYLKKDKIIANEVWIENNVKNEIVCAIKTPGTHKKPILIKNLVKICTDKYHKQKIDLTDHINGKLINDNSSDSGYEESQSAQDTTQVNPLCLSAKGTRAVRINRNECLLNIPIMFNDADSLGRQ